MQDVFEKIIEKLNSKKTYFQGFYEREGKTEHDSDLNKATQLALDDAIEIVKQEAEQYTSTVHSEYYEKGFDDGAEYVRSIAQYQDNGWISCSDRLPEIRQDCLVTVRYTGFMGMHGIWIKTGHMEGENDWWGDFAGGEVIAWQPLPEPYQPKGENDEKS